MAYAAEARINMITNQLEPSGVSEPRLIQAIKDIPRENFVPQALKGSAYLDEDILLDDGRYMMEPRIFAKMLQAANIQKDHKVLDVASGTGYSAAVIAQLSSNVIAVESNGELAETARRNLHAIKSNVKVFCASIAGGYSLQAPYNCILVNGAIEAEPTELFDQLATGGKLYAVKVSPQASRSALRSAVGQATCWTKTDDESIYAETLFDAAAPILKDFTAKAEFTF